MPFPLSDWNREAVEKHFRKRSKQYAFTWNEDFFIEVLRSSQNKHDLNYAGQALRKVGTARAVPFLKPLIHFPVNDVRAIALLTVAHIAQAAESEWYAELLLDPKFRMKDYALWAIQEAGDARALPSVMLYFGSKRRAIETGKFSSFQIAMGRDYLHRLGTTAPEHERLILAVDRAWEALPDDQRERHQKMIAYYKV